jgi:LysR family transcriptional activator of glutamate synthase operon
VLVRDLSWLVALADSGHMTETAAILRTTQPTVSRALARIERELGTTVFERSADGLLLTPAGELVVTAARDITGRYTRLHADLRGMLDPESGVVRLAFLDSIATSLVPQILRAFHEDSPRVQVLLRQEPSHEISDDLQSGAVEVAFSSAPPAGDFEWFPVQQERLVLVVPPGHRLRDRKRIRLQELADERMITNPVGFGHRRLVDGLLRAAGVAPQVSFESQDHATIVGLVAAGLGIAIVPEPMVGQFGTVGIRIDSPGARRTIGLTWRARRELSAPAARFRDFVTRSDRPWQRGRDGNATGVPNQTGAS